MTHKLGILVSHPIQYYAPLFRVLAQAAELKVYFAHRQTAQAQADAGFGVGFEWDVDLLEGYPYQFLQNRARQPGVSDFFGCDTPQIAEEIRQGKFDAFLVMGWYLKSYWQAVRACHREGVPVLVRGDSQLDTPRGRFKQWAKEVAYPHLLRQFDGCLYVGQKNRDYLVHYGVSEERLFFSPHCVDNDWFASRASAVDRVQARARIGVSVHEMAVLFVGKLIDVKRPLDLIRALGILTDQGIPVRGVFAGDGPLRRLLEAEGRSLNVPLQFLGFCNQSELPSVYVAADLLVLPSSSETWGLVINESLACGTPVVVSDAVGCAADLVALGQTGAVYPAGNAQALAAAVQEVLAAPPLTCGIKTQIEAYSAHAAAQGILLAMERSCGN